MKSLRTFLLAFFSGAFGVCIALVVFVTLIYVFFNTPYLDGVVDFIDNLTNKEL